jgi:hypothetical protein
VENLERGRVGGQSRELDFTPWAGAYNRVRVKRKYDSDNFFRFDQSLPSQLQGSGAPA